MTETDPPTLAICIPGATPPDAERFDIAVDASPELADLSSLFSDLLVAGMAAHHLNSPEIQSTGFLYLRRACWEGAIIAYARCFGGGQGAAGGARASLDTFLRHLSAEQLDAHRQILRVRNKRIGHHVAAQSGQNISVFAGVERPTPGQLQLTVFVRAESEVYDSGLLFQLEQITLCLREHVGRRIDELRTALARQIIANPPWQL